MNTIKRTLAIVLCAFFICASVPAQLELGPQRLLTVPAKTLRTRTRISGGGVRWGTVMRVGGVSFDTVATPADNFDVSTVAINYLSTAPDGERLSVVIDDQRAFTRIYDWQLIPIARFADSEFDSCFTLFGELENEQEEAELARLDGYAPNYHESFKNTLMGLRLFQLDNLIINDYSWDLVKNGGVYILGAGESAPSIRQNQMAQANFRRLNPDLVDGFDSYLISGRRRRAVFRVEGSRLIIEGQPSYTFVRRTDPSNAEFEAADLRVEKEVRAQLEGRNEREATVWLIDQVVAEAEKYDKSVGDDDLIKSPAFQQLLSIEGRTARRTTLTRESLRSLFVLLIDLRVRVELLKAWELPVLNESISSQTAGLRAINPAVWDAGVNVLRYAAFFRYCKQQNPAQWRLFMSQIARAPAPRPFVTTPTKFVPQQMSSAR